MARIFPPQLDPDTESYAERRLYDLLAAQLPHDWIIFHSARWLSRDTRRGSRDGEADFVIVDPDRGVLVLKAKGGNIRCEGGQWYTQCLCHQRSVRAGHAQQV